ncbi:MAG: hypothetical protein EAZ50_05700 [Runella slithyformis]|nr:MAG: hypothetical protein EAZ50_05700 [Runella slithyformis]
MNGNGFAQPTHQISTKQIADINQLVEDLVNKDKFSGTVLIAKGNKILYQKALKATIFSFHLIYQLYLRGTLSTYQPASINGKVRQNHFL